MKYKITVIDSATGEIKSEIIENTCFPTLSFPIYYGISGIAGIPVKVELVLEATQENTIDTSETI